MLQMSVILLPFISHSGLPCTVSSKGSSMVYGWTCQFSQHLKSRACVWVACIRLFGEPAVALFQATEATASNTWPWAKVACMEVKASSEDICEVQLKVAANDTVQLEVKTVSCLDLSKCTFCTCGNSCSTEELSDMAASAVSLKSVLPSLSSSGLRKMLLQMKMIESHIIFCQCTVYNAVEEMLNSTTSQRNADEILLK